MNSSEQDNFPSFYKSNGDEKKIKIGDWLMMMRINDIIYDIAKDKGYIKPVTRPDDVVYAPKLIKFDEEESFIDDEYIDEITDYFHNKTLKWIKEDHEFASLKKHLKYLKTVKGYAFIRKTLKSFVKTNKINWYDLRTKNNYDDIKEHIRLKMKTF